MAAVRGEGRQWSWEDDLASLVEDTGIHFEAEVGGRMPRNEVRFEDSLEGGGGGSGESLREQVRGFLDAAGELIGEFGRSCWDIARQSADGVENSRAAKHLRGPAAAAARRLRFLNDYLPEDRDPTLAWPVVIVVSLVALSVLAVNREHQVPLNLPKKVHIHPPGAARVQLPDGRYMAYREQGVSSDRARFSMIAPHTFLSSRLAGIPGIRDSLLEEFGVRLIAYDLPGFGESDPHPGRDLNSSAIDILHLANILGLSQKFWVVGYSGGAKHAWAALRYIPDKIAGALMLAPMGNPYDSRLTKQEKNRLWSKWTTEKKLTYSLAQRLPYLLHYLYRRSILSGTHGPPEQRLSLSLGKKDKALLEDQDFKEFWERDVEESLRQVDTRPFVEETILQVSNWGFSVADIQVQKNSVTKGFFPWLKSFYSQEESEWTGFLGPIHIWQGLDDQVVPPAMSDFASRVVPGATVHMLPGEGHFSYFYFCHECHRHILSTVFGDPQGPSEIVVAEEIPTVSVVDTEEEETCADLATED